MQTRFPSSLFIVLLFTIAGCSPRKGADITRTMSVTEIVRLMEQRGTGVTSLTGYGQISIDTPELSNTGNIAVRLLKPDSLQVEITGPFGVGVAKGIVTSSRLTFYNGMENRVYLGATSSKNIRTILRMSVEFADILNLFAGSINITNHPPVPPAGSWKGETYVVTYAAPEERSEYVIDPDVGCVVRMTRFDSRGEIIEDIQLKDFQRRSDQYFPHAISIHRPSFEQTLLLLYESVSLNERPIEFSLKVPDSATKVYL